MIHPKRLFRVVLSAFLLIGSALIVHTYAAAAPDTLINLVSWPSSQGGNNHSY